VTVGPEVGALLSIGSNRGDRKALVDAAVTRLAALPCTSLRARSSYYRTEPVGPVKQAWFLNIAVALRTELTLEALAAACRTIEADLGRDRTREIPSGPRPIDIDVLTHGDTAKPDDRAFVLVPLAEIASDAPIAGVPVRERLAKVGTAGVAKLPWSPPPR
jgi:2-amino-4-hydroxy-6-hydroxymethyldihydropteridine diphosphokinase